MFNVDATIGRNDWLLAIKSFIVDKKKARLDKFIQNFEKHYAGIIENGKK